MPLQDEIQRRRTFAIISHPDAGKTTLTEKLLLYGGAVQLAGSVRARKNQRSTASDWMDLEKQRGISVSSTVLQFDFRDYCLNLLDTPGHKDFSEDTYRVLTAVDAVIMVIDAAKGIESQTLKLFEVCRKRQIPIFTFMNKLDRPSMDPLELLDQLEQQLNLKPYAMNWPLGDGPSFRGVFDRQTRKVHLFERTTGGAFRAPVSTGNFSDPFVKETLDPQTYARVHEQLEMMDMAGTPFNRDEVLSGHLTPVCFGSAANNFGIELLLESFVAHSPIPRGRRSGADLIEPTAETFSGFIFKIQGNMDPKHRDRVSFMRVCSGVFTRGMELVHVRTGESFKLANAHRLFGQERQTIEQAFPGDIVGLIGYDQLHIGDTLSQDPKISYNEIPRFLPEFFAFLENPNPGKFKPFRKGVEQLLQEGVVQSYQLEPGTEGPLLAAVGPLQFEVVQYRLQSEYGAESTLRVAPWKVLRWVKPGVDKKILTAQSFLPPGVRYGEDVLKQSVLLFASEFALNYFQREHSTIELMRFPPHAFDPMQVLEAKD